MDKKEKLASKRCFTMLRCIYGALRFTTVELQMLTMHLRFYSVLVLFKMVALQPASCTVFLRYRVESIHPECPGMSRIHLQCH